MLTNVKQDRCLSEGVPLERTAVFDRTGDYRYCLGRRWQREGAAVAFIMLNPSQADAQKDDPTLRACIQFAQRWQFSSLCVVNLFGYRTAYPTELKKAAEPVGSENDAYVLESVRKAEKVVLAWGNEGGLLGRDRAMLSLLKPYKSKLTCLQLNRSGQPRHPLYIKRTQALQPYRC